MVEKFSLWVTRTTTRHCGAYDLDTSSLINSVECWIGYTLDPSKDGTNPVREIRIVSKDIDEGDFIEEREYIKNECMKMKSRDPEILQGQISMFELYKES